MIHHPVANRFVVAGEVALGDRRIRIRPQRLVGVGDRNAHHHHRTPSSLGLGLGNLGSGRFGGLFCLDLAGGLILAQSLEGGLAQPTGAGPAGELDLGHQIGARPVNVGFLGRAGAGGKGAGLALDLLQPRRHPPHGFRGEASANAADIDQLLAAIDAGQQRAKPAALAGPAADHHLVAAAALGLSPVHTAAGFVRRIETLGDNALEMHPTGRSQHRVARRLEVIDVAQGRRQLRLGEQSLQSRLAFAQRQLAQIVALDEQKVEGKEDQLVGLVVGQSRLKHCEVRRAVLVQRHNLAVEQAIGKRFRDLGDAGELGGPVQPLPRTELCIAVYDAELNAIAIELDLVRPSGL